MPNLMKPCKPLKKAYALMQNALFLLLGTLVLPFLIAQNNVSQTQHYTTNVEALQEIETIEYAVDWQTLTLSFTIQSTIADDIDATESLYSRQNKAYQTIQKKLPTILSAIVETLPFSSQHSLSQFTKQHKIYESALSDIYTHSSRIHHTPHKNLFGISVTYTARLTPFITHIILPQFSNIEVPRAASLRGIFHDARYRNNAAYTHLVFSVEEPLSVLGENSKKQLFTPNFMPRVVAQDGRIVYTPEYFEKLQKETKTPDLASVKNAAQLPFQYMDEKTAQKAAFRTSAFTIIPLAITNQAHPNIVISNKDARTILGSELMRENIRKGAVVFIIPNTSSNVIRIVVEKKEQ